MEYFDKLCCAINTFGENSESDIHPSQKTFSSVSSTKYETYLSNSINNFQRHTKCGNDCLRLINNTFNALIISLMKLKKKVI